MFNQLTFVTRFDKFFDKFCFVMPKKLLFDLKKGPYLSKVVNFVMHLLYDM
jgi:hypothetical protein